MFPPPTLPPTYAIAPAPDAEQTTIEALGEGSLDLSWAGSGFSVCASGSVTSSVRVTGVWTLTAVGTGGGLPAVVTSTSTSFSACVFVPVSVAGAVHADLSYVGAGTGILVHSVGEGVVAPVVGPRTSTLDLTPGRAVPLP